MDNFINKKFASEIKFTLDKIIQKEVISNAYIFHGPENIGKKETALRFIAEIIKTNNSDFLAYSKIKENNYPDYLSIEPTYISKGNLINKSNIGRESNQKAKPIIRIEQIRNIKDFLSKKSIQSKQKFVLIENADLLNESASNCLLKTLEEPNNGVFILLTSKYNLLLDTIISRCQTFRFKPYSDQELKEFVKQTKFHSSDFLSDNEVLENLIFISNGSPGKLFENLEIWDQITEKIKNNIKFPLKNFENILSLTQNISNNLDLKQQLFLLNYIQINWWKQTRDRKIVDILEGIKKNIKSNIQPSTSWEVGLIKIKMESY